MAGNITITKTRRLQTGGFGGGFKPTGGIKRTQAPLRKRTGKQKRLERQSKEMFTKGKITLKPTDPQLKGIKSPQVKTVKKLKPPTTIKIDYSQKILNPKTGKFTTVRETQLMQSRALKKSFIKRQMEISRQSKRAKMQRAIKAPIPSKVISKIKPAPIKIKITKLKRGTSSSNFALAQQIATAKNMPFEVKQKAIKTVLNNKEKQIIKADPLINPFLMKPITKGAMQVTPKAVPKTKIITKTAPATKAVPKTKIITKRAPATKAVPKTKIITKTAPATKAVTQTAPATKAVTQTATATKVVTKIAKPLAKPKAKPLAKKPANTPAKPLAKTPVKPKAKTPAKKPAKQIVKPFGTKPPPPKTPILKPKKNGFPDLKKGSYIKRVNWRQGNTNRSLDLVTGKQRFSQKKIN
jgi:NADH dehydrogenase/NADH:ubiquinone oxidoreductase subunit G